MSKSNVVEFASRAGIDLLTEVCREGAVKMLMGAIEAEIQAFLGQFEGQIGTDGRSAVVRNGYLPARELQTGIGPRLCENAESTNSLDVKPLKT